MKHGFWDDLAYRDSPLHRLDPRIKILGVTGGVILCVSTKADAYYAFAAYASCAAVLFTLSRLPPAVWLKRVVVIAPFVLMVAAFAPFLAPPSAGPSGGYSLGIGHAAGHASPALIVWNVTAKAFLSASLAILLTSTTPFPLLLQGLRRLRMPDVVVMLLSFAYRYLFVMTDEFHRMRLARDARGYRGRWLWQAGTLGHMIASLFLRTYERAERIYLAMVSRGFTGRFAYLPETPLRSRDGALLVCFIGAFLGIRIGLS